MYSRYICALYMHTHDRYYVHCHELHCIEVQQQVLVGVSALPSMTFMLSLSASFFLLLLLHARSLEGGNTQYCQVKGHQWIQRKQPRTQGYSLEHESAQSA